MAKRIRLSDDDGSNWYTLPGSEGEMSYEGSAIDDTVFGQSFKSEQPGLIGWTVSSNAVWKGFAGYVATLKRTSGSSTTMTAEACSLVSGKTYQVTNSAKRIMDVASAITVLDNATPVSTANIESIDFLFGRVTFISSYTPTTPITITGKYWTTSVVAKGRSFTLTQTAESIDNSTLESVQANSGHQTFEYGLKTVTMEIGGVYDATNDYKDLVAGRATFILELQPAGNTESVARGFFKPMTQNQSGNVGDLEEETINFNLNVPVSNDLMYRPFGWLHTATTLSTSLQKALTAWETNDEIDMQYLPDGTNGVSGNCIVTEISLSGGLEGMNEFSLSLQGTGALTDVP